MIERELLVKLSELAWDDLCQSLNGLTREQAWATVKLPPGEYLHTEGSILSQIAHVANGKFIYGSVAFRNTEIRWRELSPKIDSIWPDLDAVIGWLREAHEYWMSSWADIEDFELERPRFDGSLWPTWKLIGTVMQHDQYHAGQIHLQRATLAPASNPPPAEGNLWQKYCHEFPSW